MRSHEKSVRKRFLGRFLLRSILTIGRTSLAENHSGSMKKILILSALPIIFTNTMARFYDLFIATNMHTFLIKPLSTNDAWKGRQYSTWMKKDYEQKLSLMLRGLNLLQEKKPPYSIHFRFFVSTRQDWDNCCKVTQDILCKHLWINDSEIHRAVVDKIPTKPGFEHFEVEINSLK